MAAVAFSRDNLSPPTMTDEAKPSETRLRAQQAKEFLIAQVLDEAQRENVPLSEVERKMLYFTVSCDPLPDAYEVNCKFERDYDRADYEKKIADLLRNARERNKKESPGAPARWKQAVADISKEDHYLCVMLDQCRKSSIVTRFPFLFGIGLALSIGGVIILGLILDPRDTFAGWVDNHVFGRRLNNPGDHVFEVQLLGVLGGFAATGACWLARRGELGELAESLWRGTFGSSSSARRKKDSRE